MIDTKDASLSGRVIIMTGGVRGLGREMALALIAHGAKVVVTGSSKSEAMADTIAMAEVLAGKDCMVGIASDVSDFKSCQYLVNEVLERFGALHVLVNNAGIGMRVISETYNTVPVNFWEIDPDQWRRIMD